MSSLRHKILIAPFPFGELTSKKTRPVLCLTDPIGKYDELVLAYITTKTPKEIQPSDILLRKKDKDFERTKLLYDSTIRLHKVLTLPKDMIIGELGELGEKQIIEVKTKLTSMFHI